MLAGDYRISAAVVKKSGPYLDRFASHEAHVQVVPGDNISVVLTLRPLGDTIAGIGNAELRKMGVSLSSARSFN